VRRCGLVAIVGRPNVGKSTLLNALVGQKISITSNKAQTTRHRITGVRTEGESQFVFVDTPGFQTRHDAAINRSLNRAVTSTLADVDVVLFVVEAGRFGRDDETVLALLPEGQAGAPGRQQARHHHPPRRTRALAAGDAGEASVRRVRAALGHQGGRCGSAARHRRPLPARAGVAARRRRAHRPQRPLPRREIVREKLFRLTGDELPYTSTVVIDKYEEEGNLRRIAATIVVEREPHKAMIIGSGGERLKRIGTEARHELEHLLDAKVFLELWVKVRGGWADDEAHLRSYGYE
jgi:GTP-binding protein Era